MDENSEEYKKNMANTIRIINEGWKFNSTKKYDVFSAVNSSPHFHYTRDRQTGMIHGTLDNGADGKTHFGVDIHNMVGGPFNIKKSATPLSDILRESYNEEIKRKKLADEADKAGERMQNLTRRLEAEEALADVRRLNDDADPIRTRSYRADVSRGPSDGYGLPVDYTHIADEIHKADRPVIDAPMAPSIGSLLARGNAGIIGRCF